MAALILTLGLMFVGAAVAALVAKLAKQPLILGYVAAGLILGPAVTGIISDPEPIALLSELGLIFLMFIIGIELDLSKLKGVGSISAIIGTIQVVTVALIGALGALLFGFTFVQGLYLGLLIAFSSTLVVVKILVDRNELTSLHGELTLGILVVQDILAVFGLSLLGALGTSEAHESAIPTLSTVLGWFGLGFTDGGMGLFLSLLVAGALFSLVTFLFFRLLLPPVSRLLSSSSESFFVSILAAVFFVAMLAGFFEFSLAIGAFVAGIGLSSSFHSHDIIGRVKPLRDFFLILFFVSLGLQVLLGDLVSQFFLIAFLLAGGLVVKPLVTFFALKLFRYNDRTAFLVSVHLAQIGEFGLILITAGVLAGALPQSVLTGAVLTTIFTMTLTAYIMKYDETLFRLSKPYLSRFTKAFGSREEERRSAPKAYAPDAVIFGVNAMTADLIELFLKQKRKLLLVESNPNMLRPYKSRGIPAICTDPSNEELYETTDFSKVEIAITTLQNKVEFMSGPDANVMLIQKLRLANKDAVIVANAETEALGRKLYFAGATLVLIPSLMGRKFLHHLLEEPTTDHLRAMGKSYANELRKGQLYLRE